MHRRDFIKITILIGSILMLPPVKIATCQDDTPANLSGLVFNGQGAWFGGPTGPGAWCFDPIYQNQPHEKKTFKQYLPIERNASR